MSWIKLETHIFDKPEVSQMSSELNIDEERIVAKLCKIWCWFDANAENGAVQRSCEKLLDRIANKRGFCNAMRNAGWLHINDETISIPHYDRHNSQSSKKRALTSKRVSKHRAKSNVESVT